ncbi:hypothetical protein ACS0TY_004945 [Phlomoides rotata]
MNLTFIFNVQSCHCLSKKKNLTRFLVIYNGSSLECLTARVPFLIRGVTDPHGEEEEGEEKAIDGVGVEMQKENPSSVCKCIPYKRSIEDQF